jgi:hypothetical protein
MTATPTIVSRRRHIRGSDILGFVVFSGSYTAAGDPITAAALGLQKFDSVTVDALFQGATHCYFFSVVPTTPDANGRFTAFTLAIADMTMSTGATADLSAAAYPAALTAMAPGMQIRAAGN